MKLATLFQKICLLLLLVLLLLSPSLTNAGEVILAWDANTEEDLAGYKLHYGTVSGVYTNTVNVGNVVIFTIPNLAENVTYYFAATAYDQETNESDYSNEVSYMVVVDPDPEPFPIPACCADIIISKIEVPVVTKVIVDNGDPNTSSTGTWRTSSGPDPYGDSSLYSSDSQATYTFQADITGNYAVHGRWTYYSNRCQAVSTDIYNGSQLLETVVVNHRTDNNQWNQLGNYLFSGVARIVIHSQALSNCSTCADAVRFRKTN